MLSKVFTGYVSHKRFEPSAHSFRYPYLQTFIDLDELEALASKLCYFSFNRFNLVSFYTRDFLNSDRAIGLKKQIIKFANDHLDLVESITTVCCLSQPRILGLSFNPLSMFYCYAESGALIAIIAEVHNTPWNERHRYALPVTEVDNGSISYRHQKCFHVSPFNPIAMEYQWQLTHPSDSIFVSIDARLSNQSTHRHFVASMALTARPMTKLLSSVIRFPLLAVTTLTRIYAHAAWLFIVKKIPFYDHPATVPKQPTETERSTKDLP